MASGGGGNEGDLDRGDGFGPQSVWHGDGDGIGARAGGGAGERDGDFYVAWFKGAYLGQRSEVFWGTSIDLISV